MAEAYTRLIELKVKDTDLGRALDKLTKSLEKIEKKLDVIGGKGGKGFEQVSKGAEKAAASIKKLEVSSSRFSKVGGYTRASIVGLGAGLVAANAGVTALDRALRKVWDPFNVVKAAADATTGKLLTYKGALLATAAAHAPLTAAIGLGTAAWFAFGSRQKEVFQGLLKFPAAAKNAANAVGTTFKNIGKKPEYPSSPTALKSPIGAGGWRSVPGLELVKEYGYTKEIKSSIGGLTKLNQELSRGKRLQENLNAFATGHARAIRDVAETQVRYNVELLKTKVVQAAVTADIMAGKAAWGGMLNVLQGAGNALKGVLGSFAGSRLGKEAGVIGINRAVEKLITHVPLLDQKWKQSVAVHAHWTAKVVEGISAVRLGMVGLDAIVGAATGFIKLEKQAVLSFHNINAARRKLDKDMNTWFSRNAPGYGKRGGAIGPTENKAGLLGTLFGPIGLMMGDRMKDELQGIYGGTSKFKDKVPLMKRQEEALSKAREELSKLHSTSTKFASQLAKVVQLEEKMNAEIAKREKLYKKISPTEIAKREKVELEARKKKELEVAAALEKAEAQKREKRRKWWAERKKEIKNIDLANQRNANNELKRQNDLARKEKKRLLDARRLRNNALSSAAIGGAFPLLFGQGPFAAAGGAIGGYAGGMMGGQAGFAGSLIGTQAVVMVQQLVTSITKLSASLGSAQGMFDLMSERAVFSSEKIKLNVQALLKQGETSKAAAILTEEWAKVFGEDSLQDLAELKTESEKLNKEWQKLTLSMQLFLTGPLADLISMMNKAVKRGEVRNELAGKLETLRVIDPGRFRAFVSGAERGKDLSTRTRGAFQFDDRIGGKRGLNVSGMRKEDLQSLLFAVDQIIKKANQARGTNIGTVGSGRFKEGITDKNQFDPRSPAEIDAEAKLERIHKLDMFILESRIRKLNIQKEDNDITGEKLYKAEREVLFAELVLKLEQAGNDTKKQALILKQFQLDLLDLELNKVNNIEEAWKNVNQAIRNDVQEGIKGLIKGTATWADMLNNVADKFLDIALNQAFYGNMMGKMGKGDQAGGIFGALAGFGASIFGGGKAAGGPVTGGNSYVVGERGPELFVPRSGGNIVPNNAMGNVTVNVDASGSSAQGDGPSSEQLGQLIGAAIQNELIRQKRPGGLLG